MQTWINDLGILKYHGLGIKVRYPMREWPMIQLEWTKDPSKDQSSEYDLNKDPWAKHQWHELNMWIMTWEHEQAMSMRRWSDTKSLNKAKVRYGLSMETKPRKQHECLRTKGHGMNLNQVNGSITIDDQVKIGLWGMIRV